MEKINLKLTKERERIIQEDYSKLNEYFILLLLVLLQLGACFKLYTDVQQQKSETELFITLTSFILLFLTSVYAYFRIKENFRLVKINHDSSQKDALGIIKDLASEQNWNIVSASLVGVVTETKATFLLAEMQMIFVFKPKMVLIGVRPVSGLKGRFPFSFERRKKLLKVIRERLAISEAPL
ncbi:hypothetical protein GU926_08470 [Nibribacter ruber]|uniref:Uncharacterized protein n=1 Tax=Nibribacter ruber TaxID=2698458 RepID=A0A6P1NZ08_9BACT|nr:hypothetical protein [Nibribacter ruber]QHL87469.1 hypothetical protein GU926_08470 [Nibribacter ruber]